MSKKETMDEIENHCREAFADKDKDRVIPEKWFEGIKKMPEEISKTLEKKITIIEVTNELFKVVSEGKSPGNNGLTVTFFRAFWNKISEMVMNSLREGEE